MPIPQVTDRIKEAPAVALRAVFAGIGQLLMAVDKIRAQMQEQATSSAPPSQQRPSAGQPPPGQADRTGTVTALRDRATSATKPPAGPAGAKPGTGAAKQAGAKPGPATAKQAGAKPGAATVKPAAGAKPGAGTAKLAAAPKPPASAKPAAPPAARTPAAAKPAPPAAAAQAAPIPGYDGLSVASLRARLRGLDATGVRALLDYEKANAHRDDVITMFERRLSKIENGAG
jgi:hypothetical protein